MGGDDRVDGVSEQTVQLVDVQFKLLEAYLRLFHAYLELYDQMLNDDAWNRYGP